MSFWSENYSFIKDVYDTRVIKMSEWMDHTEMAIGKVMATKVYTSGEFKRERDNFLSLCKNLERSDTKKWLSEVMEVLFRDRNVEERKDEHKRLEQVIERHQALVPKVKETQVKSEVFWKCYEYGDDLVQIFEFIDDQRSKCVRDIVIADPEATEEIIDKHASIVRIMENKRRTVEEFISKGERLMEDPKSPKFLENHVNKLKEAWDDANQKAIQRKNALAENLESWKIFEEKKVDCAKNLDLADNELKGIRKNFNMERAPAELTEKLKIAATLRYDIEELFNLTETAYKTLSVFAPEDKKKDMEVQVEALRKRLVVLGNIDQSLASIYKFNQELAEFDKVLTELDTWANGKAQEKLAVIRKPDDGTNPPDPEEKVTKTMEMMEDLLKRTSTCTKAEDKKVEIFPAKGEKISKDAREFLDRMKTVRSALNKLDEEVQEECRRFSGDVKFFAEYQTGLRHFYPWLVTAEEMVEKGLNIPDSLVSACNLLGDCKTFQDECECQIKTLEDAGKSALKMTYHKYADNTVSVYRKRWEDIHKIALAWVKLVTDLVECWNKLDGRVVELTSWVNSPESEEPAGSGSLSIEKLEEHLSDLKQNFREKEEMVEYMKEACHNKNFTLYPTGDIIKDESGEGEESKPQDGATEGAEKQEDGEKKDEPKPEAEPTAQPAEETQKEAEAKAPGEPTGEAANKALAAV